MSTLKNTTINDTGFLQLPVGTTTQRPTNPESGMIRFNSETGQPEIYNAVLDGWQSTNETIIQQVIQATGGSITDIELDGKLFRVHTFTSSGTFDVAGGGDVDVFVVGGGGGGGNSRGGGGGAGGLVFALNVSVTLGNKNVLVGDKGLHIPGANPGTDGQNSSVLGLTALGGGGGGAVSSSNDSSIFNGRDGGSGGGARRGNNRNTVGGAGIQSNQAGDSGTFGFGNDGANSTPNDEAAGGGGAGAPGATSTANSGLKTGGDGLKEVTFSNTTYNFANMFGTNQGEIISGEAFFAGGGGGQGTTGGLGGGGQGANNNVSFPGQANTGGGGGGGSTSNGTDGGSGIVIIRYRIG